MVINLSYRNQTTNKIILIQHTAMSGRKRSANLDNQDDNYQQKRQKNNEAVNRYAF